MLRFACVMFVLAFLPITASAANSVNIGNTNCSGNLTTLLLDGASFTCSGDFTLTDGFVTSDSFISISADGDLFINHLNLTAPKITLSNSSGMLAIGSSAVINAGATITLNSDYISIAKGAELTMIQDGKILLTPNPLLVIQPGGNIELGSADNFKFSSPVPETSTYLMILLGLGLISSRFRAKKY